MIEGKKFFYSDVEFAVRRFYGITPTQLRSSSHNARHVRRRWVAIYLARELTTMSLPHIGDKLHKDHTTILWGYRRAVELLATNEDFSADVQAVRQILEFTPRLKDIVLERMTPPAPAPIQAEAAALAQAAEGGAL